MLDARTNNNKNNKEQQAFFNIKKDGNKIYLNVKSETKLLNYLENLLVKLLLNNKEIYDNLNIIERTRLVREALKLIVLASVTENMELEPNELYLVKINNFLKSEHFFSISNVNIENDKLKDKLPGGYVIDRITELEYLSKKKLLASN